MNIIILRKEGWELNPDDNVVNSILRRCVLNGGNCPCITEAEDPQCPCSDYRLKDICHCHLYIKKK